MELDEQILDLLGRAPKPVSLAALLKETGGNREAIEVTLRDMVNRGQASPWPTRSGATSYWTTPVEERAEQGILLALAGGPLSGPKLRDAARRHMLGCAKARAEGVINDVKRRLAATSRIFVHPRTGTVRSDRFGLQPADPRNYLDPVHKAIETLAAKLAKVGVPRKDLDRAIVEMLGGAGPETATTESVEDLAARIFTAIPAIEPAAPTGAMASLAAVRGGLSPSVPREVFDRAVLLLRRQMRISLHEMYMPESDLTDKERQELVRDEEGRYYVGVTLRHDAV
jgi:hypothetical protein